MWRYFFGLFLGIGIGEESKVKYRYIDKPVIVDHKETLKNNQMNYRFNK